MDKQYAVSKIFASFIIRDDLYAYYYWKTGIKKVPTLISQAYQLAGLIEELEHHDTVQHS